MKLPFDTNMVGASFQPLWPSGEGETPSLSAVEAQLAKILRSDTFSEAERLRHFLAFVVGEHLQGQGDGLKEAVIGVAVFRKPASFDPRLDSTVRAAASRLRRKLHEYYSAEGRDDAVLITLPEGHYIPRFAWNQARALGAPEKTSEDARDIPVAPLRSVPPASGLMILALCLGAIGGAAGFWAWFRTKQIQSHRAPSSSARLSRYKADDGPAERAVEAPLAAPPPWGRMLAKVTSEGGSPTRFTLSHAGRALAVTPDGLKVYATDVYSRFLSVVHTADGTVKMLSLPRDSGPLAMSPDGTRLYVGSTMGGILIIDTGTDELITPVVQTPGPIIGLALTPDGQKLFIAASRHGIWRLLTTTRALRQVTTQILPEHVEVDPGGRNLYVSYQKGGPGGRWGHDALEVFDTVTEESLGTASGPPIVGGGLSVSTDSQLVLVDGLDACSSPDYDHLGCPTVPSRVFHFMHLPDRRFVKTLGMPIGANSAQFIDTARVFFAGNSIMIMDAIQYTVTEKWEHKPDFSIGVALLPAQRKMYVGGKLGKEILVFEAERPECSPPSEGLAAFYPADGAPDDTVGGDTLTASGGVRFEPGRIGQAFVLDGRTGYLHARHTGRYRFGYRDSSVAAYVKFASALGDMTLLDRTSSDDAVHLRLMKTSDQRLVFEFRTRASRPVRLSSQTTVAAGRWYHVCVTKDDQGLALYVDGIRQDRKALAADKMAALAGEDLPLHLGATKDHAQFLHGKLDEVLFYNRALSEAEVRHLYEMRESGACRI